MMQLKETLFMVSKRVEVVLLFRTCFLLMILCFFCQATKDDCKQILDILQMYQAASGQHVNFQKSTILFGKNVQSQVQQNIINLNSISRIGGLGAILAYLNPWEEINMMLFLIFLKECKINLKVGIVSFYLQQEKRF